MDVWQKTCYYLYFPRLKDDSVFRASLALGTGSKEHFGIAYGKEGEKYIDFSFGKPTPPILDGALLLIEPSSSATYAEALPASEPRSSSPSEPRPQTTSVSATSVEAGQQAGGGQLEIPRQQAIKRRFYGSLEIDPVRAKYDFSQIVDEVVLPFVSSPDVKVSISIEIQAESSKGFDDGIQRTVMENCNVLKFRNAEFEK